MQNEINSFLDFLNRSRSIQTHTAYKTALQTFVDVVGNDAQLTKDTYIKFLRKTSDMNPSTQALCRSAIKGLYLSASDNDPSVNTSFFQQTDKRLALKLGKRLPIFNREGIEQIIEYMNTIRNDISDLRDKAFVFLLADTGLRVSEACGLYIGDIDWQERRVAVIGKGNKEALVHLSNRVVDALREYLLKRGTYLSAYPLFIRHDKRVSDLIKPVDAGGMWYAIKRRAKEAGVDPKTIRVHDFRHYFVTIVYYAKGIKVAQKLARHENVETTSRYTHLVEDEGEAYDEIFNKQ